MNTFQVSYTETLKGFDGSLRTCGLAIINQAEKPIDWFSTGADYAFGIAFRNFVAAAKVNLPKGKRPNTILCTWDGKYATISLPSGKLAVSA